MEQKQNASQTNTGLIKQENVSDQVLARVKDLQDGNNLQLPSNYSVSNALKAAWLVLQEQVNRDNKPILEVCTKESIANSLFDMVIQGLSVAKKQGYFIPYGNKLQFSRSYFGTSALAKRVKAITEDPVANVVYEGDEFEFSIDPKTGFYHVVKHVQTLESMSGKIKSVYCILQTPKGDRVAIMTMDEVRKCWNQGATKGKSPAHTNFEGEMAKKTIINRACKMAINSSSDAWLIEGTTDEDDPAPENNAFVEDADFEDVTNQKAIEAPKENKPETSENAPY